jgi:hypothetical protein
MELVTKCDIVAPCGRYADARVKHYDTSRAHITEKSVEISLTEMAIETDRPSADPPPGSVHGSSGNGPRWMIW